MPAFAADLTHERLTELLSYDRDSGLFLWRVTRPGTAKAGDEAGTLTKTGAVAISVDGHIYSAARLAWFYCRGTWPEKRLYFADRDKQNLSFMNLVQTTSRSADPHALRQRRYRARRALVNARIAADPQRYAAWQKEPERVINEVTAELREYANRYGDKEGIWRV